MKLKITSLLLLIVTLVLTNASTSVGQVTVSFTLNANDEDASIADYSPGTNYANEIEYQVGGWTINSSPYRWRNVFKFDLSSIPSNATIKTADLSLYYATTNTYLPGQNGYHNSLTHSNECVLQQITSPWSENSVTWNNQPSSTNTDQVIIPQSSGSTQDYPNLDVKALVQRMVASPATNYGFLILMTDESPYASMIFASGDNPEAAKRPLLTITYDPADTVCLSLRLNQDGEDASIADYSPLTNYPNEIEYQVGGWTINSSPYKWRNVFKFDLSSIPSNAIVQSADLSLFYGTNNTYLPGQNGYHNSLTHSNECVLQRVTLPWTESTVTWYHQPMSTTTDQVIIPQSSVSTQDYPNLDVKAMVQQMVNSPASNYGFLIMMTDESPYASMIFASGDHPDSLRHPLLELCYTVPVGINEIAQNNNISIYPNPITSSSILQLSEPVKNAEMVMYDMLGKEILKKNFSGNKTEIEKGILESGIYFVRVNAEEKQFVQKIIVE